MRFFDVLMQIYISKDNYSENLHFYDGYKGKFAKKTALYYRYNSALIGAVILLQNLDLDLLDQPKNY